MMHEANELLTKLKKRIEKIIINTTLKQHIKCNKY